MYTEDGALVLKMEPRDSDQGTGGGGNSGGGDGNSGGGDGNSGGGDGNSGGSDGTTDGTCDCTEHYNDLKDTIALLEE